MPNIQRGKTTSVPKDGVVGTANSSNLWEVWHNGSVLAANVTPAPNGWNVAPDSSLTDYYLITVPRTAPLSSGSAYQFRYSNSGLAAGSG